MPDRSATLDGWTLAHLVVGATMGALEVPRSLAYGIIIGTELIEFLLRRLGVRFFDETQQNVALDLVSSAAAYEIARAL